MPSQARVLPFRARRQEFSTAADAVGAATLYLDTALDRRDEELLRVPVEQPDVLLQVCLLLRERVNTAPSMVAEEAATLYRRLAEASADAVGLFDERDFFLGETALIAGGACRLIGRRAEADRWLNRAEAGFRHTVNPAPQLARVTLERLAVQCDASNFDEVVELCSSLTYSFVKFGMLREQLKCMFVHALALKGSGRHEEAYPILEEIRTYAGKSEGDPAVLGLAAVHMGDIHSTEGRYEAAVKLYAEALPLLQRGKRAFAVAHLRGTMAETLRRQGSLSAAVEGYREAAADYSSLGMVTWESYLRIVTAEALLEAGRPREAEWELLAALPAIEEQKMVPEGFAALALLRESLRQRRTDSGALAELREHLKAANS